VERLERVVRVLSSEVAAHRGERIRVSGWLQSSRRLGKLAFLVLRDGSGVVQCVAEDEATLEPLAAANAQRESVLDITGEVREEPQAPGGVELHRLYIEVVTPVSEPTPVLLGKRTIQAQLPALLEHAVLTTRHPTRRAVFRLGAAAMAAFRHALDARGFVEIQSPKLVGGATEGGANVFQVEYFGRPAYLAQSPQFYKQAMVGVFERVYEVGPVFRAEPHDTVRHINQYVSMDVELGFIEDHFTVMGLLRDVLAAMLSSMKSRCQRELSLLEASVPEVPPKIPHVDFVSAREMVGRHVDERELHEPDLSPRGEKWLGQWAEKEHGSAFLFVVGYPMSKRPFYTHPDPERPELSRSFDLLFRGTELVTGGQRLHRYGEYLAALHARGMKPEPFASYLEAFRYGMPPHGGFAIGLERLLMQLLGAPNIRLTTLFPRDLSRLAP
jgi:nondiscriminating aspartyl-tRNA synthetase